MWTPEEAFRDITRGDEDAYKFLEAFYLFVHKHDDLCDRDKPVKAEETVWFNLNLFIQFTTNKFYLAHHQFLLPILIMSGLAWVSSEDYKKRPDVLDRITAQVLKSEYVNIMLAVAFLKGGFEHSLAMARKYREYAFDDEKPA
jgi:hypothetical protein